MRPTALAFLGLALLATPANAVTRYVNSPGASSGACITPATACTIAYGINGAGSSTGDTVIMLVPATFYDVSSTAMNVTKQLTIKGDPSGDRPLIKSTTANTAITIASGAPGTSLSHLVVQSTNTNGYPIIVQGATTSMTDLDVKGTSVACVSITATGVSFTNSTLSQSAGGTPACLNANGANGALSGLTITTTNSANGGGSAIVGGTGTTMQDSTFTSLSPNQTFGIQVQTGATVRRITAHATYVAILATGNSTITDSVGIAGANGAAFAAAAGAIAQLRNDTAWASGATSFGLWAQPAMMSGATPGSIVAKNVIARGDGTDLSTEQAGAPCIFPPCPLGSITIDHSNFRTKSATNITDNGSEQSGDPLFKDTGAFDFHLGKGSPAIDAGVADASNGTTDHDGNARVAGAAPDLGAFETDYPPDATGGGDSGGGGTGGTTGGGGGGGTSGNDTTAPVLTKVSLAKRRFRGATRLRFTLSEPALVTVAVRRAARKAKRVLFRKNVQFKAGAGKLRFRPRRHGHGLAPGRYRVTIRAKDAAGNLSKAVTLRFRILAPR